MYPARFPRFARMFERIQVGRIAPWILAGIPKGTLYEVLEGIFEGTPAVIAEGMPTITLERNLSRFSKATPVEIPEEIPGGCPEGTLGSISGRILSGAFAESLVGIPEIITEEILGGI